MTSFVTLTATNLGVDRVATSPTAFALYENLLAVLQKDATAVAAGAVLANSYVVTAMIADLNVTQGKLANAAVGQAQLKTTTGDVTTNGSSNLTLPGGEYGFYPTIQSDQGGIIAYWGADAAGLGIATASQTGTGLIASAWLSSQSPSWNARMRQRYVQASPPYDLGNGEVPLFVFALVDNATGAILATYAAPDPPWANNGPTFIRPEFMDAQGKGFRRRKVMPFTWQEAKNDPVKRAQFADQLANAPLELYEITQAVKQADMPLIPHPFQGNDLTGKTVVLIDPVSRICEGLLRMHEEFSSAPESVAELLHGDYLRLGNTPLPRSAPPGVIAVSANWKPT